MRGDFQVAQNTGDRPLVPCVAVTLSLFILSCVCHSTPLCARMWSREPPLGVERCAAPRWFMVKLSMVKAEIKVQPWDMYLHQNGAQSCTRSYQACRWCFVCSGGGVTNQNQVSYGGLFAVVFKIYVAICHSTKWKVKLNFFIVTSYLLLLIPWI
jgi:hypothetical protein